MLTNQQRSIAMFSKLASFTFAVLVVANGRAVPAAPAAPVSAAQDVRELLVAARGVAPSLCTLAADGVYSWGGRWTAPAEPVRSDIRSRVRRLHRRHLAADESRALLEGIASTDACERHLSATLIGRFGDSVIVRDLSTAERGRGTRAAGDTRRVGSARSQEPTAAHHSRAARRGAGRARQRGVGAWPPGATRGDARARRRSQGRGRVGARRGGRRPRTASVRRLDRNVTQNSSHGPQRRGAAGGRVGAG